MEQVEEYGSLQGADLRKAKEVLAYEATKIVHGEEEAEKAKAAAKALFNVSVSDSEVAQKSTTANVDNSIPTKYVSREDVEKGIPIFKLFESTGLSASGSEARRLIEQGGAYINNERVTRFDELVTIRFFVEGDALLLRAGKKKFHRIKLLDKK
jgi:tyrosyl-tRNA synthetase